MEKIEDIIAFLKSFLASCANEFKAGHDSAHIGPKWFAEINAALSALIIDHAEKGKAIERLTGMLAVANEERDAANLREGAAEARLLDESAPTTVATQS